MKDKITKVALKMVKEHGLVNLTSRALCNEVGMTHGAFKWHMKITFGEFVDSLRDPDEAGVVTTVKPRTYPEDRKRQILNCALELARNCGYDKLTQQQVAKMVGVSRTLVTKYYPIEELKYAVMELAVKNKALPVVAQGILDKHPAVAKLTKAQKEQIINAVFP